MDKHLELLAKSNLETKFVKVLLAVPDHAWAAGCCLDVLAALSSHDALPLGGAAFWSAIRGRPCFRSIKAALLKVQIISEEQTTC